MLKAAIKPVIKGALAGGLIMFLWYCISWMALPFHENTLTKVPNDSQLQQVLEQSDFGREALMLGCTEDMSDNYKHNGALIFHTPLKQRQPMSDMMIFGAVVDLVTAGILTLLVIMTVGSRSCFCQYSFCMLVGILAAILAYLPSVNWWGMPWNFAITGMMDIIVSFTLAGVAIVQIVRRCYVPELAQCEMKNSESE